MMVKPTMRGFILKRYLLHIVFGLVLVGFALATEAPLGIEELRAGAGVLGFFLIVIPLVHAKLYEKTTTVYTTEDDYIVYERGILHHNKKKIAINNITDTAISATLLERIINTRTLKINTGGSLGYEAEIEDLDKEEAEELHDFILNRKRSTNPHNVQGN